MQEFASTVGDRVFFDTDSTELNASAQTTLVQLERWDGTVPPVEAYAPPELIARPA